MMKVSYHYVYIDSFCSGIDRGLPKSPVVAFANWDSRDSCKNVSNLFERVQATPMGTKSRSLPENMGKQKERCFPMKCLGKWLGTINNKNATPAVEVAKVMANIRSDLNIPSQIKESERGTDRLDRLEQRTFTHKKRKSVFLVVHKTRLVKE